MFVERSAAVVTLERVKKLGPLAPPQIKPSVGINENNILIYRFEILVRDDVTEFADISAVATLYVEKQIIHFFISSCCFLMQL